MYIYIYICIHICLYVYIHTSLAVGQVARADVSSNVEINIVVVLVQRWNTNPQRWNNNLRLFIAVLSPSRWSRVPLRATDITRSGIARIWGHTARPHPAARPQPHPDVFYPWSRRHPCLSIALWNSHMLCLLYRNRIHPCNYGHCVSRSFLRSLYTWLVNMFLSMSLSLSLYIHTYIYIYTYTCVYIYIYTHICIHTHVYVVCYMYTYAHGVCNIYTWHMYILANKHIKHVYVTIECSQGQPRQLHYAYRKPAAQLWYIYIYIYMGAALFPHPCFLTTLPFTKRLCV